MRYAGYCHSSRRIRRLDDYPQHPIRPLRHPSVRIQQTIQHGPTKSAAHTSVPMVLLYCLLRQNRERNRDREVPLHIAFLAMKPIHLAHQAQLGLKPELHLETGLLHVLPWLSNPQACQTLVKDDIPGKRLWWSRPCTGSAHGACWQPACWPRCVLCDLRHESDLQQAAGRPNQASRPFGCLRCLTTEMMRKAVKKGKRGAEEVDEAPTECQVRI